MKESEEEFVDFEYLISLVEDGLRDVDTTDDLIDKFLGLTDLKITVDDDEPFEMIDIPEPTLTPSDDDIPTEELARIYYSQGLYREAKDIYNKLFLLYSEKITYFATQIAELSKKTAQMEGEFKDNEDIEG